MTDNIVLDKKSGLNKFKDNLPIGLILLFSAFLNIWRIWGNSFANKYYAAGVYSMGQNLHAFFFNSLDSAGFVTIDKPPLGFWIQVLFTKIFGFSGLVLILPEAIASLFSVYLIYRIIKKRFSKGAGLIGAAILALTPIFVAVSRNNTIDAIMILFLILASQQALLAAEKASMKHLIFAGVLIGLGFNVKMLQAYMIVPAIYLTYLILAKQKFIKKIMVCAVSVLVMIVISLSWVVAVDLVSEESRPYIGSSDTNSALDLAIGYNGLNRIIGRKASFSSDSIKPPIQNENAEDEFGIMLAAPNNRNNSNLPQIPNRPNANNPNLPPPNAQNNQPQKSGRSAGGESGEAGLFRLFNDKNAGQISWFMLPAIFTCVLLLYFIIKRKLKTDPKGIALFFFAMCFVPMFVYFSFSSGLAHRYYFATFAPFIAGLIAIGFYYLINGKRYWIPIVFASTAIVQFYIQMLYYGWWNWLIVLGSVVLTLAIVFAVIAAMRQSSKKVFAVVLCTLLILPGIWSLTPMIYSDNSQLPIAGPELAAQNDSFDRQLDLSQMIEYLNENRDGAKYLAVTKSSMDMGAELILQSGEAVMVLGGFNGGDDILTFDEFIEKIKANEIRYAVIDRNVDSRSSDNARRIYRWITENCKVVRPNEYGGQVYGKTLYQLYK